MSKFFLEPYGPFGGDINVTVDLSNYATKTDLKNATHVNTSSVALKTNLDNLKTEVDKLEIDKLIPVPTDLSNLRNVVRNDVVKKTVYDKLVAKVYNIDTSGFVLKTKYHADKTELENKIPNVTDFVKKAKLTELENKIPDISNLATKTALTTVENKIPDVGNLVKKTDYNTKVTDIENKLNNHNHDKYIDTQEFNKLATDVFNSRIAQVNLIAKTELGAKLSRLNQKITKNKAKHLPVKNELDKLKNFDSNYFIGKSHFDEDGAQNYLVFQPMVRYFKVNTITNTSYVSSWESKGLYAEGIKPPTTSDNSLTSELIYYGTKTRVKFSESCLQQSKISCTHSTIVTFTLYLN